MGTRRDCSRSWGDTLSLGADPDACGWGGRRGCPPEAKRLGLSVPVQAGLPAGLQPGLLGLGHAHRTPQNLLCS